MHIEDGTGLRNCPFRRSWHGAGLVSDDCWPASCYLCRPRYVKVSSRNLVALPIWVPSKKQHDLCPLVPSPCLHCTRRSDGRLDSSSESLQHGMASRKVNMHCGRLMLQRTQLPDMGITPASQWLTAAYPSHTYVWFRTRFMQGHAGDCNAALFRCSAGLRWCWHAVGLLGQDTARYVVEVCAVRLRERNAELFHGGHGREVCLRRLQTRPCGMQEPPTSFRWPGQRRGPRV